VEAILIELNEPALAADREEAEIWLFTDSLLVAMVQLLPRALMEALLKEDWEATLFNDPALAAKTELILDKESIDALLLELICATKSKEADA
jgi:hypothetical protein